MPSRGERDWTATLERLGARTRRGADDAALLRFRDELGLLLPEDLKGLYRASDGFRLQKDGLRILPLSEAMAYAAGLRRFGIPRTWGYFPFVDADDSNPFCVVCEDPLHGHVVQVRHDDSAKLTHRDLRSFFAGLERLLPGPVDGNALAKGDFDDLAAARTQEDSKAARELLSFAATLPTDSVERVDAQRFAITLAATEELAELSPLLDDDPYVHEVLRERLPRSSSARRKRT